MYKLPGIIIIFLVASIGGYYLWQFGIYAASTFTADSPSFQANLTNTLDLQAGVGKPTFTRATIATVTDFEGLIKNVKSGEARFEGARRVGNLVSYSEAFDNWGVTTTSVTPNVDVAPDGTVSADRITFSAGCSSVYKSQTLSPGTYVLSVYAKTDSISNFILQAFNTADGSRISSVMTTTSNWKRFKWTMTVTTNETVYVYLSNSCAYVGSILAWGYQVENVTGQANQNPSEYVSTNVKTSAPYHGANVDGVKYFTTYNGNTVASNVVTEATGGNIPDATLHGYVAEGARTNAISKSEEADHSDWTKLNATITTNAITSPSGTSTADKVIWTSSVGNHDLNRSWSSTAGTVYTYSFYAKAGEITSINIVDTTWTGASKANYNLSTGVVTITDSTFGFSATMTSVGNGWYRCTATMTAQSTATVAGHTRIRQSSPGNDVSGFYFWGAQLEAGSFASSYIPTTTASVTRNADVLTYPTAGNVDGTKGTAYAEVAPEMTILAGTTRGYGNNIIIDFNSGSAHPLQYYNSTLYVADGTNAVTTPAWSPVKNTQYKISSSWGGSSLKGFLNGVLGTPVSFDGNMNNGSSFCIATYVSDTDYSWNGTIRNVKIWKKALTDSQLTNMTSTNASVSQSAVKTTTVGADGSSFQADLKSTLDLQAGVGKPTFTRATIATVTDFEGLIKNVKSGEARFEGARRVENLLTYSEDFSNAAWSTNAGATKDAYNTIVAPDGTLTADTVSITTTIYSSIYRGVGYGTPSPDTYTVSVWLKVPTGTSPFKMYAYTTGSTIVETSTLTATTDWKRFSMTFTTTDINLQVYPLMTVGTAGTFHIWGMQIEKVTGQANQNPSEYVSTGVKTSAPYHGANVDGVKYFTTYNGNTVASNVVIEATGAAIPDATLHGYVAEGARTNLALQSEDITTTWVSSPSGLTTFQGTGLEAVRTANYGVAPNGATTADRLQLNLNGGTTSNDRSGINLSNNLTTSVNYTSSIYVKPLDGTSISTLMSFLGIGQLANGGAETGQSYETLPNGWYRIKRNCTPTVASGTFRIQLTGGYGVNTLDVLVWGMQYEQASFASSYIPTTTASVTRNGDALLYPTAGNFDPSEGTISIEPIFEGLNFSARGYLVFFTEANPRLALRSLDTSANFVNGVFYNGATTYDLSSNVVTAGTKYKYGFVWGASAVSLFQNGIKTETDTTHMPPTPVSVTSMGIGVQTSSNQHFGTIRNVRIWKKALTDTQLTNMTSTNTSVSQSAVRKKIIKVTQSDKFTSGLVGMWSFNGPDMSGLTAYDRSGNNNNGTLTGRTKVVLGKNGQGVQFDGEVDDYINLAPAVGLAGSATFSVSFWSKPTVTGVNKGAFAIRNGTSNTTTLIIYPADNATTDSGARVYWNSASIIDESTGIDRSGSWHHYLFVSRSSTDHELYVDGQSVGTSATSKTLSNPLSDITIGAWYPTSQRYSGSLDEVRIYNRALSANEILQLYNMGR
jgi:hypothetical protein